LIRKYQSNFGTWYAQAEANGSRIELAFDHEPTEAEVDAIVAQMAVVETVELVAENGELI